MKIRKGNGVWALVSVGRRGLGPGFEWLAGSMSFVSKVFTNVMS